MAPRLDRVIPIRPTWPGSHAEPRLSGDPARVRSVADALGRAVQADLGLPAGHWLRALSLDEGEAHVAVATGLGPYGVESAGIAFDTLRRLLPDTDIYIGEA